MRGYTAIVALAVALSACSSGSSAKGRRLPDARLPTLGGIPGASLASCPTDKCLTVVVAPWCGVCHQTAPSIVQFRRWLDARGISSRVVVGASNDAAEIRKFAAEFGSDALLDDDGAVRVRGVPLFLVTDREGRVLKSVDGFPSTQGPEDLARYLDLL